MNYDILMKISDVKAVKEISINDNAASEIVVTFSCETPFSESDTCAMICRHYNDGGDFNTVFFQRGKFFDVTGIFSLYESENITNVQPGSFVIQVTSELAEKLKKDDHNVDCENVDINAWLGDLFDKDGSLIMHD
ncbi:hypothetical protein AAGW04_20435 [Pectobacterium aroidearum]|uniref:hypothetical protein n=1 Tax=Pectobacterium aroidearum TaxID=1201031 RepID=UPI0031595484